MQDAVDAVDTVNIGGGNIVISAKRSNPHSMQYAVYSEYWWRGPHTVN